MQLSRRAFVVQLSSLTIGLWACRERATELVEAPDDWSPFPVVEAHGDARSIGAQVGAATREAIHAGIEARRAWFDELRTFALADRGPRVDRFWAATRHHHPEVAAELEGLATGAGLPLDDVLVLNLQTELGAMMGQTAPAAVEACDDCSTLHLVHGEQAVLAHNEDGHDAYRHTMAVLRLFPEGRPAVTAFAYPGVIPGNVPAATDAGVVQATNFIGGAEVHDGVPRYVLGRAALGARSLDEAVQLLQGAGPAYTFHANLGSVHERRLVAVDVAPGGGAVEETRGVFVQTNHFVLPVTRDVSQPKTRAGGSSYSRYQVLERAVAGWSDLEAVRATDLVRLLASHEAVTEPFSPCRHPRGEIEGRTLGTAVFDLGAGTFTLYEGNPCEDRPRVLG